MRPHLDYCDVIYDKPHNEKFTETVESFQYKVALAITGAIKGTSKEKLYNELGLEYLKDRRWTRRLRLFHKIYNLKSPTCLYNLTPSVNRFYDTINNTNVPSFKCRTKFFKNSFFPNVITEWNKLDINIKSLTSYTAFKNALLSFIRPKHVDTFGIHNPIALQLLTRLRLGFSHLNGHKLRHNFRDFLNPLCECKLEPETTSHFLLRFHLFQVERTTLLNDIKEIDERIISDNSSMLNQIVLYRNDNYNHDTNKNILLSTVKFCIDSKRFEMPLL